MRAASIILCALATGCGASSAGGGKATVTESSIAAPEPGAQVSEGTGASAGASPVFATLSLERDEVAREAELMVTAHIENRGKDPVILMEEELSSPAALFEVRDAVGQRVAPTVPSRPLGGHHPVAPGKAIEIKMSLAGMYSPPLRPGEYSVRIRRIESTPRRFRVVAQ